MPNYNKSFSFRNGVQVDEDNFFINSNGLVGIGTTIPRYTLDLYGDASISGLTTAKNLNVTGVGTFNKISVGNSITLTASSGIVSAVKFYGDGSTLTNIPTSQWVDVDPSAAYVSIYSKGSVGIGTTDASLPYIFTVGRNPDTVDPAIIPSGGVGINSFGSIKATGIITAGQFSGPGGGITEINASNISSGTLNNARLPSQINLPTGIATIRDVVVSSGATISGISTFNIHGLVTKGITVRNLNFSGISTVSSTLEISSTGSLKFSGGSGIYIANNSGSAGQFLVANGSNGLAWSNNISLPTGIITAGLVTSTNFFATGFTTTNNLRVNSTSYLNNLTVTKITSGTPTATNEITRINSGIITTTTLDSSYSQTGVTTASSIKTISLEVTSNAKITSLNSGNVKLNEETNTLTTSSGDLKLGANSKTVLVQDNLSVTGSAILSGIATVETGLVPDSNGAYLGSSDRRFTEAYIDDIRLGVSATNKIDTGSGDLVLDSTGGTVNVQDNLDVDGNLNIDGSAILSGIATVGTGLLPDSDGAYLGSSDKSFTEAHINNIRIGSSSNGEIDTRSGNLLLDSTGGTVEIDDNVDINESLNVDGNVYLTGITTVGTGLLPDSDGAYLGSSDKRFTEAHINNIRLGVGNVNQIDTRSGNLVLNSTGGTVEIDDNVDINQSLNVDGDSYLSGIATVGNSLLPSSNNSVSIGSTIKAFSEAHIDELQIGLPSAAGIISTRSGNLSLDSLTRKVTVSQDLSIGRNVEISGIATIANNLRVGSDLIPSTNTTSTIGSASLRFAGAHIDDIRIGVTDVNVIDTRTGNLLLNSTGGTVEIDDNVDINQSLNVDGDSYLTGITTIGVGILPDSNGAYIGNSSNTFSEAHIDNIRIGVSGVNEIDTKSGNLRLNSTDGTVEIDDKVDINESLNVDGQSYLSGIATVGTSLLPGSDGGATLGSSAKSFSSLHVGNLNLGVSANEINTRSGNLSLNSTGGTVTVNDKLSVSETLNVDGQSYLSGIATVAEGLLPDSDLGAYLGSSSLAFSESHVGNIRIGAGVDDDNTIATKSGDLKLKSDSNIIKVVNNLKVDGTTELTGITSVSTGIVPTSDKSGYLGSLNYSFENAHINNIRIAVASTSTIDTVSGDLILQSNSNFVQVNDNLVVGGGLTVTNNISAGTFFVNNITKKVGIGTTNPENALDLISDDSDITLLVRTRSSSDTPSIVLKSGSTAGNIQFNELEDRNLTILNQGPGSIVNKLHSGNSGINTGDHIWKYKDNDLMSLTYNGKLGIGITNPLETVEIVGTSTVTGNSFVGGNLKIKGDLTVTGNPSINFPSNYNFNVGIISCTRLETNNLVANTDVSTQNIIDLKTIAKSVGVSSINVLDPIKFTGSTFFVNDVIVGAGLTINNGYQLVVKGSAGAASTISGSDVITGNIDSKTANIIRIDASNIQTTNLNVTGITTVYTLNITSTVGLTTFSDVSVASSIKLNSSYSKLFVGTQESFDNFVGIGTSSSLPLTSLYTHNNILTKGIIIGSGVTSASGIILNNNSLYLTDGSINLNRNVTININHDPTDSNYQYQSGKSLQIFDPNSTTVVGLGTTIARSILDFSNAGNNTTIEVNYQTNVGIATTTLDRFRFILPPSITSAERVGLATVEGAFIFNKTTKQHQMYDGTTWHDMY
jgi:hypothetical protein